MFAYVIRRVLYALPIALWVSIVCFTLIYLAPGNPLQTLLPESATELPKLSFVVASEGWSFGW